MTMIDGPCRSSGATSTAIQLAALHSFSDSVSDDTNVLLSFTVSRDEEHVELRAEYRDQECDLGERVHHYPLLLLVRLRAQDLRRGVAPDSAGWVGFPELAKMLGMDAAHLYIQLFRLRQQIGAALSLTQHPLVIVERRRGQLRAAAMSVRIAQGATVQIERLSGADCAAD
jgi:hypothetical protein